MPFLDASPLRSSYYELPSVKQTPKPIESFPVKSKPAEIPAEVAVKTTWAEHVKRTREESGGSLKEVLKRAKETYKK
jgi:hypothetical protein